MTQKKNKRKKENNGKDGEETQREELFCRMCVGTSTVLLTFFYFRGDFSNFSTIFFDFCSVFVSKCCCFFGRRMMRCQYFDYFAFDSFSFTFWTAILTVDAQALSLHSLSFAFIEIAVGQVGDAETERVEPRSTSGGARYSAVAGQSSPVVCKQWLILNAPGNAVIWLASLSVWRAFQIGEPWVAQVPSDLLIRNLWMLFGHNFKDFTSDGFILREI